MTERGLMMVRTSGRGERGMVREAEGLRNTQTGCTGAWGIRRRRCRVQIERKIRWRATESKGKH